MVLEQEIFPYLTWLLPDFGTDPIRLGALLTFLLIFFVLAILSLLVGFLVVLVRGGPMVAGDVTYRAVSGGVAELFRISRRRVSALAGLAWKEAMRRRVLVTLGVFVGILMFATWFMSADNQDPAKVYVSFVLTATTYLMLLLALLLSTFSLPNDISSKTIYTIVTKPVRSGDIVLGRILGFTAVGTALLAVMGVCSYVFVHRSLSHTHDVNRASLTNVPGPDDEVIGLTGLSENSQFHRHTLDLDPQGFGFAESEHGHTHSVAPSGQRLVAATPADVMRARVPLGGKLRFLDNQGSAVARGTNVGMEWQYRSFVAGNTRAAAIWTFSGISEAQLQPDADGNQFLPIELIVRVFRTYKGDVTRGITGSVRLRNPDPIAPDSEEHLESDEVIFTAKDYAIDTHSFPRELTSGGEEIDLLDDLVSEDGRLEVVVQCFEPGQYFGFAQADCYVRLPDRSPLWNFVKAYLTIWVQMVIVIAIGVACSTFLNGPISLLFTVSIVLLGFFRGFFIGIATGVQPNGERVYGGGPVEALVRMVTHKNLTSPFTDADASQPLGVRVMTGVDDVLQGMMWAIAQVLPDFRSLSTVKFVAEGFSIPADLMGRNLTICLAYVVGLTIAGYLCLRAREVAK